jgi:hypothetical protein
MQQRILFSKFTEALSWNAFLYIAHRILSTTLVFVLYRSVPSLLFSTWATLMSIIYLMLLWFDFGFRKSIARYVPIFTEHGAFKLFTRSVLIFQLTVLALLSPVFYYSTPKLFSIIFSRPDIFISTLLIPATLLFVVEGLVEMLRLLYHAHFLNKPFNILSTTTRLLESSASIALLLYANWSPIALLSCILLIKAISSSVTVLAALIMLPRLYSTAQHDFPRQTPTALKPLWYKFIRHSSMMWISNIIKSLSERNFIIPVITHGIGAEQANIFKLAQDSALFFERSIMKTIGTADTALLAHAASGRKEEANAFDKLTHQVAALCIPLFGILLFIALAGKSFITIPYAFVIFLLLTASYLLEVLLSPYERLLEVKQRYLFLATAYLPYVLGLLWLLYSGMIIGLVGFVIILQGVRLVSSCIMVGVVHYNYGLRFPIIFAMKWLLIVLGITLVTVGIIRLLSIAISLIN